MKSESVLDSWKVNAKEWIKALETQAIDSRSITNPAIVDLIERYNPKKVLDAGCGEGWLSIRLQELGISGSGIDATEDLIERAKSKSRMPFYVQSFEQLIQGAPAQGGPFEAVVFNFCLYLKDEVPLLLKAISDNLNGRKLLFIQTLHPFTFIGSESSYKNQWIEDSWKGLKGNFVSPF